MNINAYFESNFACIIFIIKYDNKLRANFAQTQFSASEFSVQGQSSDMCLCTTHYNAYSLEKGHNNAYSPK